VPLLTAFSVGTALAPLSAADARQAEVVRIIAGAGATNPHLVTLNGATETISFNLTTTETTEVTAIAEGPGLSVVDPVQSHTSYMNYVHPFGASFDFPVTATTPGMHALTVTFFPEGGTPQSVTLPYVISEGSTAIAGTGSLAGRTYGWESVRDSDASPIGRSVSMLTFVNDHYAFVGLPPAGRPTCTQPGNGCLPYVYDVATRLLQVGADIVGKVHRQGLYTDGWIDSREQYGGQFSSYTATQPLTYAAKNSRLAGVWQYRNSHYHEGMWNERVVLRKDHTYTLVYRTTESLPSTTRSKGTYRITKPGRIVFTSKGQVFSIGTLALAGRKVGKPNARKAGLWLILSGRKGKHPDGNLLQQVR
jgi:hypothetical protein